MIPDDEIRTKRDSMNAVREKNSDRGEASCDQASPSPRYGVAKYVETPLEEAKRWTSLHRPHTEEVEFKCDAVRVSARAFIENILTYCPGNADRSASVRKAREALQAAIASLVVPQ